MLPVNARFVFVVLIGILVLCEQCHLQFFSAPEEAHVALLQTSVLTKRDRTPMLNLQLQFVAAAACIVACMSGMYMVPCAPAHEKKMTQPPPRARAPTYERSLMLMCRKATLRTITLRSWDQRAYIDEDLIPEGMRGLYAVLTHDIVKKHMVSKNEPCLRYNRGRCYAKPGTCKFGHFCSRCQRRDARHRSCSHFCPFPKSGPKKGPFVPSTV